MSILETVKAHPYLTAGGVFVVGIGAIFLFSGNSASTNTTVSAPSVDPSIVASNNALQQAQSQLQAYVTDSNNKVQIAGQETAAGVTIATLQNQQALNHDTLSATVASLVASLTAKSSDLASTLGAGVSTSQINAGVTTNKQNNDASVAINAANTNEVLSLASIIKGPQSSDPYVGIVTTDYENLLGREPDTSGLAYWTNLLRTGQYSPSQLEAGFMQTPEYARLHG